MILSSHCRRCTAAKEECTEHRLAFSVATAEILQSASDHLLVVLVPRGEGLWPELIAALDEQSGGRFGAWIKEEKFTGTMDEHIQLDTDQFGLNLDLPRHLLLIGMGGSDPVPTMQMCSALGLASRVAFNLQVERVFIAFSHCSTGDLARTAAMLHCRAERENEQLAKESVLQEMVVIAKADEVEAISAGLGITRQLCTICSLPEEE